MIVRNVMEENREISAIEILCPERYRHQKDAW
jgi:hypothetical protein